VLIYAAIGAFGLLFLLVMLFVGEVFGGDHEVHPGDIGTDHGDVGHEGGPSIFSARIMASFLTAFGVGGVIARYYELSHPASAGVGVVSGVVMASVVYQFAAALLAAGVERGADDGPRRAHGRSERGHFAEAWGR
jgi:hypothetical protein